MDGRCGDNDEGRAASATALLVESLGVYPQRSDNGEWYVYFDGISFWGFTAEHAMARLLDAIKRGGLNHRILEKGH